MIVKNMKRKTMRFLGSTNDISDVGFAILSYEDEKTVGVFKYCNKNACKVFGVSEDRIIGQSVANVMPDMIRSHHDLFIKRFKLDGMPRMFGRVRNQFIKDFQDYVTPA